MEEHGEHAGATDLAVRPAGLAVRVEFVVAGRRGPIPGGRPSSRAGPGSSRCTGGCRGRRRRDGCAPDRSGTPPDDRTGRVVVGRRERHQHLFARTDRTAGHLGVGDDLAAHRDRRVEAQELLDRGGPDHVVIRRGDEQCPFIWVLREVPDPRADGTPGRVDAGEDHQLRVAELQFDRDRLAVDLRGRHEGQQVVLRIVALRCAASSSAASCRRRRPSSQILEVKVNAVVLIRPP